MTIRYKEFSHPVEVITPKKDSGKKIFRFVGTTESPDLIGDIVRYEGWDTSSWEKNPVILWAHDNKGLPIGKGVGIHRDPTNKRLLFDVEFASKEVYPFASTVEKLVDAGYLKAVSVGFKPIEQTPIMESGIGDISEEEIMFLSALGVIPMDVRKQKLVEISIVPIGMNSDALLVTNSSDRLLMAEKGLKIKLNRKQFFPPKKRKPSGENEEEVANKQDPEQPEQPEVPPEAQQEESQPIVQALVFNKAKFATAQDAQAWATENGFEAENVQETELAFIITQRDREDFDEPSIKTTELEVGVMALVGSLTAEAESQQQQPQEEPVGAPANPGNPPPPPKLQSASEAANITGNESMNSWLMNTADPDLSKAIQGLTAAVEKQTQFQERLDMTLKSLSHLIEEVDERSDNLPSSGAPKQPVLELAEDYAKCISSSIEKIDGLAKSLSLE